jgi:hypothetical protein
MEQQLHYDPAVITFPVPLVGSVVHADDACSQFRYLVWLLDINSALYKG